MVLEQVLEPKFLDCSTGFRPKRGCHTALKKVRSWKNVHWMSSPCPNIKYILYLGKGREGDIKKFFDRIDHVCAPSNYIYDYKKTKRCLFLN